MQLSKVGLEKYPYNVKRVVTGKVKIQHFEDLLDCLEDIDRVSPGLIYEVKYALGYGDIENFVITDNYGKDFELADYFIVEVDD